MPQCQYHCFVVHAVEVVALAQYVLAVSAMVRLEDEGTAAEEQPETSAVPEVGFEVGVAAAAAAAAAAAVADVDSDCVRVACTVRPAGLLAWLALAVAGTVQGFQRCALHHVTAGAPIHLRSNLIWRAEHPDHDQPCRQHQAERSPSPVGLHYADLDRLQALSTHWVDVEDFEEG